MPTLGTGVQATSPLAGLLSRPFEEQIKYSCKPDHPSIPQAREAEHLRGALPAPSSHSKWVGRAGTRVQANETGPNTLGHLGLLQAYSTSRLRPLFPFLGLGWVSFPNCLQDQPYLIVGYSHLTLPFVASRSELCLDQQLPSSLSSLLYLLALAPSRFSLFCILDCGQASAAVPTLEQVPDRGAVGALPASQTPLLPGGR